jgi:PPP family 3-phenylpropionic acid transporter
MDTKWILRMSCLMQIACVGILFAFEAPRMKDLGIGETRIGILLGISSGIFIFSSLYWGRLADRKQWHKKIAIWGCFTLAGVSLYFSFCTSFWEFLSYVIVKSVAIPMVLGMMPALAVESFGKDRQGRDFGIFRAFGSIGFIMGAMILPMIFNDIALVARTGLFSILASAFLLTRLDDPTTHTSPVMPMRIRELNPAIKLFLIAFFFISLSEPAVNGFYSAYARHLGGSTRLLGGLFGGMGFIALIFLPLMGKWIDRASPSFILSIAFLAHAIRIEVTSTIDVTSQLWIPLLFHGISWGGTEVAAIVYLSSLVKSGQTATVLSYYMAMRMLGNFAGATLCGYLAERAGYIPMFQTMSILAFLGAALYIGGTYVARVGKKPALSEA